MASFSDEANRGTLDLRTVIITINPKTRYLLSRPRGGMNDVLVQLEETRSYAQRYGRTLIVDLSLSGLQCNFDDLFGPRNNFGCEVIAFSDALGIDLDAMDSVYPAEITHKITTYRVKFEPNARFFVEEKLNIAIQFEFDRDYPEQLLVYEQCGGGMSGLYILRRVAFTDSVGNSIAQRLMPIGTDYDAIHIRHSDYTTNYQRLLLRAKYLFRGRRLLICTDSKEVKDKADTLLDGVDVLSIADIPDTGGVPLHTSTDIDRVSANLDLLSEFVAMARAKRFLFTRLLYDDTLNFSADFSGLAILVEAIRSDPYVIKTLFDNADPDLVSRLFHAKPQSKQKSGYKNSAIRFAAEIYERFWNRQARFKAEQIRRKAHGRPVVRRRTPINLFTVVFALVMSLAIFEAVKLARAGYLSLPQLADDAYPISFNNGFRAIVNDPILYEKTDGKVVFKYFRRLSKIDKERKYLGLPFVVPAGLKDDWSVCNEPSVKEVAEINSAIPDKQKSFFNEKKLEASCYIEVEDEMHLRGAIFSMPR